jgi:arginase
MNVSLVALVCRTADRTPGTVKGAQTLAPLIGKRLGVEPRTIGTPSDPRETRYDEDLRDSRGCLLEAGGQVEDALTGGRVPVLAAADCSIAVTTLPAALRHRPDARVLWLDAHGDYNTPDSSDSGYLGGMCLAGACGEWDAGLGETIAAERLVLAGVRDLDEGERELLERSAVTVIGASVVETLVAVKNALDGAPVFIHLDLDVIDPEEFPATAFPAPGGLSSDKLYDLMEAVAADSEVVGLEVTAFEAPDDADELADAAETAMRVLDPILDRIAADAAE